MIYTYRKTDYNGEQAYSRTLRTYKDVTYVECSKSGIVILSGIIPTELDTTQVNPYISWAQKYTIAAIKLGEGEYLEREDLPRD